MYRTLCFLTCCMLFLTNCRNYSSHNDDKNGAATDTTSVLPNTATTTTQENLDEGSIDLDTVLYSITKSNQQEDPKAGIPAFDIYLHIAGVADSVFVAREHAATFLEKETMEDYNIPVPKNVLFRINSTHDGAGYLYYGLNNTGKLEIYRAYSKEGSPKTKSNDQSAQKDELIKTVRVFNHRIEAVGEG